MKQNKLTIFNLLFYILYYAFSVLLKYHYTFLHLSTSRKAFKFFSINIEYKYKTSETNIGQERTASLYLITSNCIVIEITFFRSIKVEDLK